MSRQQKRNIASLICFYGFVFLFNIGLCFFIIPSIFVDELMVGLYYLFGVIFLVLSAIFLSMLRLVDRKLGLAVKIVPILPNSYGFKAVPRNKYAEFYIPKILIKDEMKFNEIRKNVFVYEAGNKVFTFDMNGWVKKTTYIIWLILSELQIFYTKGNRKLIYKSIYVMHKNIRLSFIFMNGKKKERIIVKNYKTILPFLLRMDLKNKTSVILSSSISLKQLYDFNY